MFFISFLVSKGHLNPLSYPFSFFLKLLESHIELENESLKKISLAVRIARFMDDRSFKDFIEAKDDNRSDLEKLNDFQKGIG